MTQCQTQMMKKSRCNGSPILKVVLEGLKRCCKPRYIHGIQYDFMLRNCRKNTKLKTVDIADFTI